MLYLIRPFPIHSSHTLSPFPFPLPLAIHLSIRGADIKFPTRQHHHDLHLEHCQLLPDTGTGPVLEGPPCAFDGVEQVPWRGEPALGEEAVRVGPVGRVALDGLRDEPDKAVVCGVLVAVLEVSDAEAGLAGAGGGRGWEEAHALFDDCGGVGQLVEEVGV